MGRAQRIAAVDALYAQLPAMHCLGRCGPVVCGSIDMSPLERGRIQARFGVHIPRLPPGPQMCPALNGTFGTCEVYELRPAVCRLWGVARFLRCRFGCVPEGGWWDVRRSLTWLVEVQVAAGKRSRQDADRWLADLATPEGAAAAQHRVIESMFKDLRAFKRHQGVEASDEELLQELHRELVQMGPFGGG